MSNERGRRPVYARVLRLRHLNVSGVLCFLFFEGSLAVGVLLALAELTSWWSVLVLPATVAAMVKVNDLVAGALARSGDSRPGAETGAKAAGTASGDEGRRSWRDAVPAAHPVIHQAGERPVSGIATVHQAGLRPASGRAVVHQMGEQPVSGGPVVHQAGDELAGPAGEGSVVRGTVYRGPAVGRAVVAGPRPAPQDSGDISPPAGSERSAMEAREADEAADFRASSPGADGQRESGPADGGQTEYEHRGDSDVDTPDHQLARQRGQQSGSRHYI
jgi:hypothetical protein